MGFSHEGGDVSHNDGRLEKGLAIIGWIIVIYIHHDQHCLSFATDIHHRTGVVFIGGGGGSIVGPSIHVSFPIRRRPIGAVAKIMTITVIIIEFNQGDILLSPSLYPTAAAVGRAVALIIHLILGEGRVIGWCSGHFLCTVSPVGKYVLYLRQCLGVVIFPHEISITHILY